MITKENILSHELIGLESEVVQSTNPQIVGFSGTIIDETKSMLVLNTKNGIKKIPKKYSQWKFIIRNTETLVDGDMIEKKPQERLGARI